MPLIVIVGPTASGKTATAIAIAEQFDGEIICADSRTVYKGLDIGTAKPTVEEQAHVRHHLLDVVNPDEEFTAADFKEQATKAINDVLERGKLPILVGGSGLYVDALLYDFEFAGADVPRDAVNPRHAAKGTSKNRQPLRANTLIVGIRPDREELRESLVARVDQMVDQGFLEEVVRVRDEFPTSKALDAPGYKAFAEYLDDRITVDEAKSVFVTKDYQLARRQMTWFKRNEDIYWTASAREARTYLVNWLMANKNSTKNTSSSGTP